MSAPPATSPRARAARVVVLASGAGSLLRSLVEAAAAPDFPADVVGVVVDRECPAESVIGATRVRPCDHADRAEWDHAITAAVAQFDPDYVVSAGFMRILGPHFLARFGGRVLNTHPALLPSFPGACAVRDALAAGVRVSGTTVHLVDEGVDTGPILAQEAVPVLVSDDESSLHERIKIVERRLLIDVVAAVAARGVIIDGRKALIPSD
ncbi:phosphoribosylglycinamide formyltransferase [Rhodococcoides corynebacterioides]|uniref:phosphoribosylglycinamide formyltransferase n=1 Tax=Rhodococcoides corynebacterioides TaxID=53972 RepID=UPI0021BEB58B|nr:phosphoribosylglycinamide formyltransferase [Rhodococcus corynebacterioides]